MSFAARLSLGARQGVFLSSSVGLRRSNAHLFSSLVQNSSVRRAPRALFAPRFLSTGPSTELEKSVSSTEIIPDTSFVSDGTEVATEVATGLASHIPPLQYGDLAALDLINWYPAGIVRWTFEVINVSMGLPWFWTIVAGTVFWRVACLPFSIYSLRESAKMQPLAKKFGDLRQEMLNTGKVSVTSLEHERAKYEYNAFQREHDLHPARALVGVVQFPVTLGLFFGVQKMTTLPVEQLTQSGFALLQDLTIPDPTYILPAALLALVNVQISVGAKDMDLVARPEMGHIMNGLRVLSVAGFFVMSNFTTGLMLSLLTTSAFTLAQTIVLQRPLVRRLLNIRIVPKVEQPRLPSMRDSLRALRDYYRPPAPPKFLPPSRVTQQLPPRK